MFKKPFRVKSKTLMKRSDRKKLREEMIKSFNKLDLESAADIVPNKEDVTVVKIYTNAGDNVFIYCVNKIPVLFEIDKQKILYPSVYLLWKYPDLVERFTTWPPVFKKMLDGADLMLPGVIVREQLRPSTFKHIQKGQICSINIYGNRCPVAVGQTLLSGSDFFDSGMKGKGIHPHHLLGDELWAFGDKSSPPVVEDDPLPGELTDEAAIENGDNGVAGDNQETCANSVRTDEGVSDIRDHDGEDLGVKELTLKEDVVTYSGACGGRDVEDKEDLEAFCPNEVTDEKVVLSQGEIDELLEFCFLCAVKSSIKKTDLPITTGTFYKQHVMKYCPTDKPLDVKKSSFKKLSKFLQKQAKTGIINVKELSKGVDSIIATDKSHVLLHGLEVPDIVDTVAAQTTETEFSPPQITEMFAITSNVLPLFKEIGYKKGHSLKSAEVRQCMTDYVKQNTLQSQDSKSEVILDPILAELLLSKAEGDRSTLKWDETFSRLINKMSPVYEVQIRGQAPVMHKGNLDPIKIDVVQRASNKKATIIENLDMFGIDAKTFAHTVQVKVACSASVTPSQQKNKGPQVVIQGNQTSIVGDLLSKTYMIPRKYIKGLEKAAKTKRR